MLKSDVWLGVETRWRRASNAGAERQNVFHTHVNRAIWYQQQQYCMQDNTDH